MEVNSYHPPAILFNKHLETIYPALFRKVRIPHYHRERIDTPDHDFLDLDWLTCGSDKLVIISHGLEGNSTRPYMRGMTRAFHQAGFDVLAWNYRGCSEEMNRQLRFYHSGATDDLDCVMSHAVKKNYQSIYLTGFSLGGNLTLKYLGEKGLSAPPHLKGAVALSVPMDLHNSCLKISERDNRIYALRFLNSLKSKVVRKARLMNGLNVKEIGKIKTIMEFDDRYTAPLHGFPNAVNYYARCSAIHFLDSIAVPTLILNARNDPFLSKECYPGQMANPVVQAEFPGRGGHVGFALFNQNGLYWSELRATQFIRSLAHA